MTSAFDKVATLTTSESADSERLGATSFTFGEARQMVAFATALAELMTGNPYPTRAELRHFLSQHPAQAHRWWSCPKPNYHRLAPGLLYGDFVTFYGWYTNTVRTLQYGVEETTQRVHDTNRELAVSVVQLAYLGEP